MSRQPLKHIPDEIPDAVRTGEQERGYLPRRGLEKPLTYQCQRVPDPLEIDGLMNKAPWRNAQGSLRRYGTRHRNII